MPFFCPPAACHSARVQGDSVIIIGNNGCNELILTSPKFKQNKIRQIYKDLAVGQLNCIGVESCENFLETKISIINYCKFHSQIRNKKENIQFYEILVVLVCFNFIFPLDF